MSRINAYNALISAFCDRCNEFKYGFYADDATFTLTIVTPNRELEIVTSFEGGYIFDGSYYDSAYEVVDVASESYEVDEYVCGCTMDELLAYIDAHENDEEFDEDGLPIEEEPHIIIHNNNHPIIEEEDPDLI